MSLEDGLVTCCLYQPEFCYDPMTYYYGAQHIAPQHILLF